MVTVKQGVQVDIELSLPVQKLWEALLNMEKMAPKIALNSHKLLVGDGGVGSISLVVFADGRYEKERVESVDVMTHTLVSTVIWPGSTKGINNQYTKTMSLSTARNGTTTVARWRAECAPTTTGAASLVITSASDYALTFFKALESYLTIQENAA